MTDIRNTDRQTDRLIDNIWRYERDTERERNRETETERRIKMTERVGVTNHF